MTEASRPREVAPLWLLIMRRYDGLRELVAGALNPVVRELIAKYTRFPPDKITNSTAWCAALACACLEKSGLKSPRSAAAIAFEKYGVPCDPFRPGAILVFGRKDPRNPRARHVAFSEGRTPTGKLLARGGNQGNRCSVVERDPAELTAARWPFAETNERTTS